MRGLWNTVLKGGIIGATMIVPGVSGGTMAIILGIYDRLISAVSSFHKNVKENALYLTVFCLSALAGLLLFSGPVSWLLRKYEIPTLYFFIGAVVGGIPVIEKKSGIHKITVSSFFKLLLGAALVVTISKIPNNILIANDVAGNEQWIKNFLSGIVSAIALILPGISFSHFLLILGLYELLLEALHSINLIFLLPLASGVFLGIVLFSKLLETLMGKYPETVYLLILGFIIGSVTMIFPGIPLGRDLIVSTMTAVAGFVFTYYSAQKNIYK